MFRYEMHLHSSVCSKCGRQTMEEIVAELKRKGLNGAVITNHFYHGNTAVERSLPWPEFVKAYLDDYLYGEKLAEEAGIRLLFGIEEGISDDPGKEVLIYGVSAEAVAAREELRGSDLKMLSDFVRSSGGVLLQAHPFRDRGYIPDPNTPPRTELIDGTEFFNAQNSPESNEKSVLFAGKHPDMIHIVGSDAHWPEIIGETFIETEEEITDTAVLVRTLKEKKFTCYYHGEPIPY